MRSGAHTIENASHSCTTAMYSRSHAQAAFTDQMAVLTGTLAHLSTYLDTGCPRSLHLARLLMHRLDDEPAFDRDVLSFCRSLEGAVSTAHAVRHPA